MSVDLVTSEGAGLRHMEKMGAVQRVTHGLSHDVAGLVEDAATSIDVALSGGESAARLVEAASTLKRVAMIARQLEALSRPRAARTTPRQVGLAMIEMLPLLRRLAGDGVQVHAADIDESAWAAVSTGQLEQVAFHLTVNARDAMPGGGKLTLSVRREARTTPHAHRFGIVGVGEWVVLAFADTGVGMDREMLDRLFEPFFTTKAPGLGSGLGLATVYGIARQLGGQVLVESTPEQGSLIEVWVPEAVGCVGGPGEKDGRIAEAVLVVDDDEWVRAVTAQTLRRAGLGALVAGSANEALDILSDVAGRCVGTVLTDLGMPGADGADLAAELYSRYPELRIVVMTGRPLSAIPPFLVPVGAVLQKPFSREELLAVVGSPSGRLS